MTEDREELLRSLEQEICEFMGRATVPVSKEELMLHLAVQCFEARDVEEVLDRLSLQLS